MKKKLNEKILAYIPMRKGSKRIPDKNARLFDGKPLMSYTIELAKQCSAVDKIIVDTDSKEYASIAEDHGVTVPFLRPEKFARDDSQIIDSILFTLDTLKQTEGYEPDYLLILQTTSPLREMEDIEAVINDMLTGGATTVLTVSKIHSRLYHLNTNRFIEFTNRKIIESTNTHDWGNRFLPNGCVYMIKTDTLRTERSVITKKTRAIVMPKWRSIDIDDPNDWVMAELIYKNKAYAYDQFKKF